MSRRFVHECRTNKRGGHIVNVLAKAAITTNSTNNTSYIAAKGGLTTMTRGLAHEVTKDGIIVNGIVPGYVQTHGHYHPCLLYTSGKKWRDIVIDDKRGSGGMWIMHGKKPPTDVCFLV